MCLVLITAEPNIEPDVTVHVHCHWLVLCRCVCLTKSWGNVVFSHKFFHLHKAAYIISTHTYFNKPTYTYFYWCTYFF